jgi:LPXTG-motif cell wall-anchored protein
MILQNSVADSISAVFWILFGTAILTFISSLLLRRRKKYLLINNENILWQDAYKE